jgi:hypothetical protein
MRSRQSHHQAEGVPLRRALARPLAIGYGIEPNQTEVLMKTSYLAGIGGGLLVIAALGGACTPKERNLGTGGAGGMASSSSSGDGMATSSNSGMSGAGGAASSSSSSSAASSSSGCADADGDGYTSKACGGNDCNDSDKQAHPGQTLFFTMPMSGTMSFDYNCDGVETPEFQYVKCVSPCMTKTNVFLTDAACGQIGTFGDCNALCQSSNLTTKTRACH